MEIRQETSTFDKLKDTIQKRTGREFTQNLFKQILSVKPSFFDHHWENKGSSYELVITSSNSNPGLFNQRVKEFENALHEIAYNNFEEFK